MRFQVNTPPPNASCDMLRSHEVNRQSIDRVAPRIRKPPSSSWPLLPIALQLGWGTLPTVRICHATDYRSPPRADARTRGLATEAIRNRRIGERVGTLEA